MQDDSKKTAEVSVDMEFRASQQLQLINEQESYIQSRADTMQNIESTIVELGSIFQQLAHMVKEQEETVQRQSHSTERKIRDTSLTFGSNSVTSFLVLDMTKIMYGEKERECVASSSSTKWDKIADVCKQIHFQTQKSMHHQKWDKGGLDAKRP
ncbi:uncharacterized protein LOC120057246 isoform X1 [Salvelinus namaycush]|uniref:Uncharacterized protein LOC120057246 isoform X1 n=1 Tax=Salvelinus namaycush TaxID=8040 RepID=A0A8U1ETL7_SALNM|nr:uncharacterized protein LOC120057246 isoform X1 [Salvelinus namaycush]XP_038861718.1 uncharacterized protein LOC120057246 isoform X1 [Salvelinus namaycush]XP_038861720.1 uncharacterized protein LOC120057246 isoform X1 [Salvelinus namaycush]